jgi:hypothetical protein
MYEDAAAELARIIALAESCPEPYRAKAFEILLQGYVSSVATTSLSDVNKGTNDPAKAPPRETKVLDTSIPPEVQTRLKAMAKRRGISAESLAGVFDFSSDPFTFAPLNVSGANVSDRSKKVALLVSARSFLATGKWQGDWAEIKAMCVHQNCYDVGNLAAVLKKAKGDIFKSVSPGSTVELSGAGTDQAEQLLAGLSKDDASEQ